MAQDATEHLRQEEFIRLYARDRERVFAYVYSLLPQHADAEDVFQRTSVLLWNKFAEFDRERSFLSWACGVAFYEAKNFLRVANRQRLQFDVELLSTFAEARVKNLENADSRYSALERCLDKLRAADRQLVDVAYASNQSLKDFAESSGQALQTLYNRLSQIRRQLLECIERRLAIDEGTR